MIMLADWHPDIIEFIISKMQNPNVLKFIIENTDDEDIKRIAQTKLKFTPLTDKEKQMLEYIQHHAPLGSDMYNKARERLKEGGTWSVNDPDFLTGANISVCLTKEFMQAVENDLEYELRFPDIANYSEEEMKIYNEKWHEVGDVREWEQMGMKVKTYRKIRAKELWQLINICATYSAEPGIFFIDTANEMTNATAYRQKVVATNPCGEQPLSPYSVCNLSAVNLSQMASFETGKIDYEKLKETVRTGIRMQDNIIDATPYFLNENKEQALGERRIGLGVMGLHDLLLKCGVGYGTPEGNKVIEKVFKTIAETAYESSIDLAKEKGSFPFLDAFKDGRERFIQSGFMKKMPEHIKQDILKYGIRNSHLLTVAPTGSTGTMMNASTGLEPYFSLSYFRSGRLGKYIEVKASIVDEYLKFKGLPLDTPVSELPKPLFNTAMDLTPEQHADVQCLIQQFIDSSISKTVNAPKGYTVNQVQTVYERLWKGGAKGGTVYVDGSRDSQVLTLTNEENQEENAEEIVFTEEKHPVEVYAAQEQENIQYGIEDGDTCPICKTGTVRAIGGCNTCDNPGCGAQLKCGL